MKFKEYEKKLPSASLRWEDDYDFDVSHLITEARVHAGLTQKELAGLIGTKQSGIARAERGSTPPGHGLLKKIARAIGTRLVPPRFAFIGNDDPQSFSSKSKDSVYSVGLYPNSWSPFSFPTTSENDTNRIYENVR